MKEAAFHLSSENWQQVQDLLADALDRPPSERTAFLRQTCGHDPALYHEVDSLVRAYAESDDFLDTLNTAGAAALLSGTDAEVDLEVGRDVGPYRILRPLGRGGMGIVYLAEDTRLHRQVALKFLPPHLAADEGAVQRLFAEARAAAALDHPHIAVVHEVGATDDERPFIAMAYYEGETLGEKIRRGPLPVGEAHRVARQVADGLRAAHRHGVVHRDIKPSNVIITQDGIAKIVDFGIARLAGVALTKTGATLGTVAYMSPEQTRGEPVDPRTDLWSLGVVCYEMLTGERPFRGDHDRTLIHAIRHDTPQPAERLRPEIPQALAHVVQRCLHKDPAQRYPDADTLLADLEHPVAERFNRWRTRQFVGRAAAVCGAVLLTAALLAALYVGRSMDPEATLPFEASRIAVLPLQNISPDAEDAYFAAGMTEELVSRLARLSGLRVIGRTSVQRYAGADRSIAGIGEELEVSAVLDGSVRKVGDEVRISVQLIDTASEVPLWSEDYDAVASDVLAVQRAIAEQVAQALHVQLGTGERRRLAQQGTDVDVAYELYLKGRYFVGTWNEDSVIKGRDALQQAIDLDPTFAGAWAGLADAYKMLDYLGVMTPEEAGPRIRAAAERALALDAELAEAHAALATVLTDYYHNWESAGPHYQRAVELDPSSGTSLAWYAEYLRDLGRFEAALETIERAQVADPLSPWYQMVEGIILDFARRPEEALDQFSRVLTTHPNYRIIHFYIGLANVQVERYEAVLAEMDLVDPDRTFPDAMGLRGLALAASGQAEEARAVMDELDALSEQQPVAPFHYALAYIHLGEQDRALDLLEQTVEERWWFTRIYKVAPPLDPVRSHPRFQALLDDIGLGDHSGGL